MTRQDVDFHAIAKLINYCPTYLAPLYISRHRCILFLYHALGKPPGEETYSAFVEKPRAGISGRYKLVVASNRDEWLDRPTEPMHFWKETKSNLLAGRDLTRGGTWLGVNRSGKFATVTNVASVWDEIIAFAGGKTAWRRASISSTAVAAAVVAAAAFVKRRENPWVLSFGLICAGIVTASVGLAVVAIAGLRRSRGTLVSDFLKGDESAEHYCARLSKERRRYAGFNLLLVDPGSAWILSNRSQEVVTRLPHGLYGVGNALLDTPWPKMLYGKACFLQVLLRATADPKLSEDMLVNLLMDILADDTVCPPSDKPFAWLLGKRLPALARVFIPPAVLFKWWMPNGSPRKYGTRSSTVVLVDTSGRMKVVERNLGDGTDEDNMRYASRKTYEFCDV